MNIGSFALRRATIVTFIGFLAVLFLFAPTLGFASEESASGGEHGAFAVTFLWIAIILVLAKVSNLVERFGQPAVLGELLMGILLGNLVLIGFDFFEPIKHDVIIAFITDAGVALLLFQIGLESNINEMRSVGKRALGVAVLGVVVPFVLGTYFVGPWLLPGLDNNVYLFLGAALTATSVGITARVFKDLGKLKTKEAKLILGAAVIDDVLGLIILAVVSAFVTLGAVKIGAISWIVAKAVLFLVGSVVLGQMFAPRISKFFSKIHTGMGMKFTIIIAFGLVFAWGAQQIGLAAIVGAFAAGLVLDPVHFRFFSEPEFIGELKEVAKESDEKSGTAIKRVIDKHSHKHIEDFVEHLSNLIVPIFFVVTGMAVDISVLFDKTVLFTAIGITVVAFIGKLVSGMAAGNVRKWVVGWGMAPRGEVGLIFASIGAGLGVINDEVFSIIVVMVILTTLVTPIILNSMLREN